MGQHLNIHIERYPYEEQRVGWGKIATERGRRKHKKIENWVVIQTRGSTGTMREYRKILLVRHRGGPAIIRNTGQSGK